MTTDDTEAMARAIEFDVSPHETVLRVSENSEITFDMPDDHGFNDRQMTLLAEACAAVRNAALEEAADVADRQQADMDKRVEYQLDAGEYDAAGRCDARARQAMHIALEIRSLKR